MARPRKNNKPVAKEAVLPKTDIPVKTANDPVEVVQENDNVNSEQAFKTVEETAPKEINKPLNNKVRDLINELDSKGITAIYPTNEANWDDGLYDRLNKLNK